MLSGRDKLRLTRPSTTTCHDVNMGLFGFPAGAFLGVGVLGISLEGSLLDFPIGLFITLAGPFILSGDVHPGAFMAALAIAAICWSMQVRCALSGPARHGLWWQYQRGLASSPAASLLDDITANFFDLRSLGMSREQDDVVEPGATGVCIDCRTIGTAIGSVGDDCMKFQFNRAGGCQ